MFIVSKTVKGQEHLYSNKHSILCKNKEQASQLASFLNKNNNTSISDWKLKDNEIYHVYEIDQYDNIPRYKLKSTKNKISIVENY